MSTVLRQSPVAAASSQASFMTAEITAKIELLSTTEMALKNGNVLLISDLQATYEDIRKDNEVVNTACSRKAVKQLIANEINDVEFHGPQQVNESERVTVKKTRDAVVQLSEELNQEDVGEDMKTLYNAAMYLRKVINKTKRWVFEGSLDTLSKENYPEEFYCFFRWVINGPRTQLSTDEKRKEVHKRTVNLVQSTMSMCLTEGQIANKKSEILRSGREMPRMLAVGLVVHQLVRSKELVNMLRGFGMSVEYNRLLRVETQLESSVIQQMEQNNGQFLPPELIKGRHTFFVVDNIDFCEDTYDGNNMGRPWLFIRGAKKLSRSQKYGKFL